MIRRSKPLKRSGLKPPTPEQVAAFQAKPRRALPRGKRPAKIGRRAKREQHAWEVGRAACVERSGGFCEIPFDTGACSPKLSPHSAQHVHHILPRGRGGKHDPSNLLHVCSEGHRFIHDFPLVAEALGLLASRGPSRGVVSDPYE